MLNRRLRGARKSEEFGLSVNSNIEKSDGDEEIRTPDLLSAIQATCVPSSAAHCRCPPFPAVFAGPSVLSYPLVTPLAVRSGSKTVARSHRL